MQSIYATGDLIKGARVEKIERDRLILLDGGSREILELQAASRNTPSSESKRESIVTGKDGRSDLVRVISPTEREINRKAFASQVGPMDAVLRSVKFSPHIVDGKEEGLRITGHEGLNVASYVGLKNGDVVQGLNGQTITNKRKAFQVLRRAQRLRSSDIEFMRGSEKKTLSLKMR